MNRKVQETKIKLEREIKIKQAELDMQTKNALKITDNLLGKLPDEVIDNFVKSKDFKTYEETMKKYGLK